MTNSNRVSNHLINETSPYLLQHAYNPVDWYPWGEEAFAKAKAENKLIFLSIGYSTCHWCHVMAHESFEDVEVARLLNDRYVSIKVDREERKDLDAVYMNACQAMTGSGGWPLNVWLTSDKLPVYAGTYFPKRSIMNRLGLIEAATYLADTYNENPNLIFNKSFEIITQLKRAQNHKETELSPTLIKDSYEGLKEDYDPVYGGFSKAPKFPGTCQLRFLLASEDEGHRKMATHTLECMAKGGVYDHIGGGFSRYSVDRQWLVPHFEKMLYDNGLLLDVYSKGYVLTGNKAFKQIVDETVDFIERDMQDDSGAFYSAFDADSEGKEGKFYVFDECEIDEVLKDKSADFKKAYGVKKLGNFEGRNILNLIDSELGIILDREMAELRKQLFNYRKKRVHPGLDDKILSLSNGFAIHGLCHAYELAGNTKSLDMAKSAFSFIHDHMINEDGKLFASIRDGKGKTPAMIDDYASVIRAGFKLYDLTFDKSILMFTVSLLDKALKLFWDVEHGGFFVGDTTAEDLIYNPKEIYDGATPSGNSMMGLNLLKAFLITEKEDYKKRIDEMTVVFAGKYNRMKHYASEAMMFLQVYYNGTKELKLYVSDAKEVDLAVKYVLSETGDYFVRHIEVDSSRCIDGMPTVYRCERGYCRLPEKVELI